MNYWLFTLPFLSALTGWAVHRIAIRLLFSPRRPGTAPPRYQLQLAQHIGSLAKKEFASLPLEQMMTEPARAEQLLPLIEEHMDDFLRNRLKDKIPMIGMLIGDKTIALLKTVFMEEIANLFPRIASRFANGLAAELDIETMVREKIAAFPADKLRDVLAPHLRFAEITGAITGFLIGGIQLVITLLVS